MKKYLILITLLLIHIPFLLKAQKEADSFCNIKSKKISTGKKGADSVIIYYLLLTEKYVESTGKYLKNDTVWLKRVYLNKNFDEVINKEKETVISSQKTALQIRNNNLLGELLDSANVIRDLRNKLIAAENKIPNSNKLRKGFEPIYEMDFTSIGHQKWTSENISKEQILAILPDIKYVQETKEWNEAFKKGIPAYCFHKEDIQKKFGVLLNIPAIKALQIKLKEIDFDFRFPTDLDIDTLNSFLKEIKVQSVLPLLISKSPDSDGVKWSKPGFDLFNMHLVPLSYRRNNNTEWFGSSHEATFYCWNKEDAEMKSTLFLAQFNDAVLDKVNLVKKDLSDDDNNFGVYVRFIKK